MTSGAASANLGHMPVKIHQNVSPKQAAIVKDALAKTENLMPKVVKGIEQGLEIEVGLNSKDQFVAITTKESGRNGQRMAEISCDGSLNALRDMFEKFLRMAVKYFPR